jgi:hypothetical protein
MDMYLPTYNTVLWAMAVMGLFVFVALYFVDAGYGKFRSKKWGLSINNKIGWVLMECPALIPIVYVLLTMKPSNLALLFMGLYAMHYIYRSFVFPTLLKGKSKMPFAIIDMGALFNFVNSSLLCASVVAFPKESYTDIASYARAVWVITVSTPTITDESEDSIRAKRPLPRRSSNLRNSGWNKITTAINPSSKPLVKKNLIMVRFNSQDTINTTARTSIPFARRNA